MPFLTFGDSYARWTAKATRTMLACRQATTMQLQQWHDHHLHGASCSSPGRSCFEAPRQWRLRMTCLAGLGLGCHQPHWPSSRAPARQEPNASTTETRSALEHQHGPSLLDALTHSDTLHALLITSAVSTTHALSVMHLPALSAVPRTADSHGSILDDAEQLLVAKERSGAESSLSARVQRIK